MTEKQRIDNIMTMWWYGHRGYVDRAKTARNVMPASMVPGEFPDISSETDLRGIDMPIPDIQVFKDKTGKNVYVGGSNKKRRDALANTVKNAMDYGFTADELRRMNMYFDASHPISDAAGGECSTFTVRHSAKLVKKHSIIRVAKGHETEAILLHEMVHARRHAMGDEVNDVNRDEKETELESVIRMRSPTRKGEGYYRHHPDGHDDTKRMAMILSDRILATGSIKRNLKGSRAVKRTQEIYDQSFISAVHFSPAEDIDGYFKIRRSDGVLVDLHVRYEKRPSLAQIKKDLKKRYGNNITAWEYVDGKRVQIIKKREKQSPVKRGKQTRKRSGGIRRDRRKRGENMVKGYSEYDSSHSKRDANKTAANLRKRGYGARVVPIMMHKGKAIAWAVLKSDRKLKR